MTCLLTGIETNLTIAVTGHRPNEAESAGHGCIRALSPDQVRGLIAPVLERIKSSLQTCSVNSAAAQLFGNDLGEPRPSRLSLATCLAEGSDRIAAKAALDKGYFLEAVLPFAAKEFENDFRSEESRAEFQELLTAIQELPLELPGDRDNSKKAYETANRAMLDHASLLIAVWDGEPAEGRGGTETVVAEAVRRGIPVIVIDASGRVSEPMAYWEGLSEYPVQVNHISDLKPHPAHEALPKVIEALVQPPVNGELEALKSYLEEPERRWNFCLHWPALLALFGVRRPRLNDLSAPDATALEADAQSKTGVRSKPLLKAYARADALGTFYAQVFRSAFVLNFALAGLAVFTVALSILLKDALHLTHAKWPFVLVEILLIGWLLLNTWFGRRRNWHRRWFESREVAERLRIALAMRRLAARPHTPSGPLPTWTNWYTRAVLRSTGVPGGAMTVEELGNRRDQLRDMLIEQRDYHERSSDRMHRLEHRMEKTGEALFFATLLAALTFVIGKLGVGAEFSSDFKYVITALTAGMPVLATATYGIRVIGDFEGNAKRSHRMAEELGRLIEAVDRDDPTDLSLAQSRARQASAIMLGDLASWRSSAESRGLAIPG